ncbi:GDSL-type esterase/lipase family protein [Promicromonospora panici]|uniref:GDSL-type esterase/lipase family protein n=1 Tax=Promicromonospora panici TaxID=2219658 RepID=UPI00101C788B|nr:GDSL-type esterase/lipase family protein [Promicromonospora panici]
MREIQADDDVLAWEGALSVEHMPGWSRPWRLPHDRITLFPGGDLRGRAAMPAGVRLVLGTDTRVLAGQAAVQGVEVPLDAVVDDAIVASAPVGPDGRFVLDLPTGDKRLELWLPQFGTFRLVSVAVEDGARVWAASPGGSDGGRGSDGAGRPAGARGPARPRLVTYGSSLTQCRQAASPARTWPALVAREVGLDLTCLGFAGEAHLDPMVARVVRDRPADVVVACLGINVYGAGSFSERSLLPALLGFLSTVRDGHPGVPVLVISPLASPRREDRLGRAGLTLAQVREQVADAVALLAADGDPDLHLLDGRTVLGPEHAHLLGDGLHPGPDGYAHMASVIGQAVRELLGPDGGARPGPA